MLNSESDHHVHGVIRIGKGDWYIVLDRGQPPVHPPVHDLRQDIIFSPPELSATQSPSPASTS